MAYNPYTGFNNYGQAPYMQPQQYRPNQMQPNYMQQPIQQVQTINPAELPITMIRFLSETEATNYIMDLNTKGLFIDKNKKIAVLKWSDAMGNSDLVKYRFDTFIDAEEIPVNTEQFLKKEDIAGFAKNDDLKSIFDRLAMLEKKIKINEIMGENK